MCASRNISLAENAPRGRESSAGLTLALTRAAYLCGQGPGLLRSCRVRASRAKMLGGDDEQKQGQQPGEKTVDAEGVDVRALDVEEIHGPEHSDAGVEEADPP